MKKILSLFLISALLITLISGCSKKDSGKLVFASDMSWAPMEFINEKGDVAGFDVDLMAELSKAAGFEYELRNTAWDGIFAGLTNGAYDGIISSVTITDERKQAMDFTIPYLNAGQVLIVKKEQTGVEKLEDMVGMKVGVQNGTTGDFAVEKVSGVERMAYDNVDFAVEDLMNGNVQGVVCDSPVAADYVLSNPNYREALKIVGDPFTDEYLGIAVKKGNKQLAEKLDKAIQATIDSGKMEELIDKWLR